MSIMLSNIVMMGYAVTRFRLKHFAAVIDGEHSHYDVLAWLVYTTQQM